MEANGGTAERPVEQLLLAGLGWLSLTAEAADEVAEDLARRLGIEPGRMRGAVRDMFASWRSEGERLGAMPAGASAKALRRLGLVRQEEMEDMALRLAQLEHRVRLLENPGPE